MSLRSAEAEDAAALAALHATSFPKPWPEPDFVKLLQAPGAFARLAEGQGFILCWAHGDEAEVLTLAVAPASRRQGLGGRLLNAAIAEAVARGVTRVVLEAAIDNAAALALYAGFGFKTVGRRPAYYAGAQGASDAYVLALETAR
jgi:ribosomal-protein-alanine N-acetyltransferase